MIDREAVAARIVRDAHMTWDDDPAQHEPFVVCDLCGEHLCSIEEGDSLAVIVLTVDQHRCGEAR